MFADRAVRPSVSQLKGGTSVPPKKERLEEFARESYRRIQRKLQASLLGQYSIYCTSVTVGVFSNWRQLSYRRDFGKPPKKKPKHEDVRLGASDKASASAPKRKERMKEICQGFVPQNAKKARSVAVGDNFSNEVQMPHDVASRIKLNVVSVASSFEYGRPLESVTPTKPLHRISALLMLALRLLLQRRRMRLST